MDLFALRAVLTLDDDGYRKGLDDAESRSSTFASVLKANLVTKGIEVCVKGLAKLGSAAAGVFKGAVDSYASYEQLVGGVETLFGSSAKKVIADADQAFKTAGMSANQYMETSIQSAASLINSLGGDQKKAAELMNLSVTDMADNVNKMGTSMEGVQNAYRGFSRGNFTMLDNLALGFAGTKEGMQQLLDKAHEISGVKYDISSYADIVQAIHVVQNEMGITGTTAKEAEKTIEGSLNSFKSAWSNLITNFGKGDGKVIEKNMGEIVTAAGNVFRNVLPVAKNVIVQGFPAFVKGVVAQIPTLGTAIKNTIRNDLIPIIASVLSGGRKTIANDNVRMLRQLMNNIIEFGGKIGAAISSVWDGVIKPIIDSVISFITQQVIPGIKSTIDSLQPVFESISPIIRQIFQNIQIWWNGYIMPVINAVWDVLIGTLIPEVISWLGRIIPVVSEVFTQVSDWWNGTLYPVLLSIWGYVIDKLIPNILEWVNKLAPIIETAFNTISELWTGTLYPVLAAIWETISTQIAPAIMDVVERVIPAVIEAIGWVVDNIGLIVPVVAGVMAGIAAFTIIEKISSLSQAVEGVTGIVKGFFETVTKHPFAILIGAIVALVGYLVYLYNTNEEARDKINAAFEAIKGFWENTLKPAFEAIYTYVTETLIPSLIDWFENQFQPAVERVFGAIAGFWENTLKPAFEAIYSYVIETLIPTLIDWWQNHLQPAIEGVFTAIAGFWENTLKPAFEAIYTYVVTDLIPTLIVWWEYQLQPAIERVFNAIKGFWENTLQPVLVAIYDYVIRDLIPTLIVWWEYELQPTIQRVFEAIKGFWEQTLKPAFEAVRDFISEDLIPKFSEFGTYVTGKFLDAFKSLKTYWQKYLEPRIKALKEALEKFFDEVIKPIAEHVGGAFLQAWQKITEFFNGDGKNSVNGLSGVFDTLLNTWLKPVAQWLEGAFSTAWEAAQGVLNGFLDFVTGTFSGNWKQAWEGLVGMLDSVFGGIKDILKTPINAVIDLLNGMIRSVRDALNTVVGFINNALQITIPSVEANFDPWNGRPFGIWLNYDNPSFRWNPGIGTINWSDNPIQKLWKGGTLGEGETAMVGEYAPEMLRVVNGRAIVTPLSDKPGRLGTNNNISINVYPQPGQSPEQIAEQVQRVLQRELTQKQVAFV